VSINKVFVYGTLMTGMKNHYLVEPYIKSVKPARVAGVLYDLPYGYPAMTAGNTLVFGELMELANITEALIVLDRLEDYHGPDEAGNLYDRVVREVVVSGEEKVLAYMYLWAKPAELEKVGVIIPGGDWKVIMRGK